MLDFIEGDYDEIVEYLDDLSRPGVLFMGSHGNARSEDVVYMQGLFTVTKPEHDENCQCEDPIDGVEWDSVYSYTPFRCEFGREHVAFRGPGVGHLGNIQVENPDKSHLISF